MRLVETKSQSRPRRRSPLLVPAAAIALLLVFPALLRLYVDSLWFAELGYGRVLATTVGTRAAIFAVVALLAFGALYGSARVALRGTGDRPVLVPGLEGPPRDVTVLVRRATTLLAIAAALLLGLSLSTAWLPVLRAIHGQPFGIADPVFGRDVGFYVFTLPLLATVLSLLFTLGVLALLVAVALYWVRRQAFLGGDGRLWVEPRAGRHLAIVGALLFLLVAVRIWLVALPELLFSTTGPLVGASYSDLHAARPGLHVTAVAALLAGGWLLWQGFRGRVGRGALFAVGGFMAVSLVARTAVPGRVG